MKNNEKTLDILVNKDMASVFYEDYETFEPNQMFEQIRSVIIKKEDQYFVRCTPENTKILFNTLMSALMVLNESIDMMEIQKTVNESQVDMINNLKEQIPAYQELIDIYKQKCSRKNNKIN